MVGYRATRLGAAGAERRGGSAVFTMTDLSDTARLSRDVLHVSTDGLRVIEIDGVRYSAEIFRTFAAPDPKKYYQFVRDGETVTVTQFLLPAE
jgi:hypothetical protein